MKLCPKCDAEYGEDSTYCSRDGAFLIEIKAAQDPLIGQVINGKYRVIQELGQGGMGKVYQAEHVKIGMKVAIKVVHAQYAQNPDFVRRFHQEARLVANLKHHNIVTLHDFDQMENGSLFIVMEFVEGRTLRAVVEREKPLEVQRVLSLGVQIAEGLAAAHRGGVVHRDIKPDNIMVVEADDVRIMDFGLARDITRLTPSSVIVGSPPYMAPEQARGERPTEATDIYAVGIVLYEMLGGEVPFKGASPEGVLRRHIEEAPAPLRKLREVPAPLEKLVMQALEKKPEHRPKSALELAQRLKNLEGRLGRESVPVRVEAKDEETIEILSHWRWEMWAGAGVVVILLIAGALIWALMQRVVEGPKAISAPEEKPETLAQPTKAASSRPDAVKGEEPTKEVAPSAVQIVSLKVRSDKRELNVKERATLKLRATYSDGKESEISKGIDWQSSDGAIAAVNSRGQVEGRKGGNAEISARYAGIVSPPLTVIVRAPVVAAPTPPTVKPSKPKNGRIQDHIKIARFFRDRGEYSDALSELEKAKSVDPANKEVQSELEATAKACAAEKKLGRTGLPC